MSALLLRPGRVGDISLLAPIDRAGDAQFVAAGHPEFAGGESIADDVARRAIEQGRLFVAELDGEISGWLLETRAGEERCIGQLSVDPDRQRRGIGRALLVGAIDRAGEAGEPTVVLSTQDDVPWNRPWYERFGFVVVPVGEWTEAMREITDAQRAVGLRWETRVHMRLDLSRRRAAPPGATGGRWS